MAKILVIEDEENLRFTIRRSLVKAGHAVSETANLRDARELNKRHDFELVLTDVMLGPETGLTFVRELRAESFDGAIVVMTAFSNLGDAVNAIRDGADDYISKPLSLEELGLQVDKWIEHRRLAPGLPAGRRIDSAGDDGVIEVRAETLAQVPRGKTGQQSVFGVLRWREREHSEARDVRPCLLGRVRGPELRDRRGNRGDVTIDECVVPQATFSFSPAASRVLSRFRWPLRSAGS